ncbi:MAG: hypothetical protein DI546_23170 [Rhizobium sp.]|nr:MAG: hypothetical protein DI546_23170 [Rhizobium sp.]
MLLILLHERSSQWSCNLYCYVSWRVVSVNANRRASTMRHEKGHGGGWVLARPLNEITLLDIYRALGAPDLFSIGLAGDNPDCVIEQAVNAALFEAMTEAESILLSRFGNITLSALAAESITRWSKVSNHPSAMDQL